MQSQTNGAVIWLQDLLWFKEISRQITISKILQGFSSSYLVPGENWDHGHCKMLHEDNINNNNVPNAATGVRTMGLSPWE
jgi:hypothetical protein